MPILHKRSALVLGLAVLGVVALSGCAVWKMGTAKQLADASTPFQANPATPTHSLLVIGDSTAVGTGASAPDRSLPGLLAGRDPALRVVNKATDGARYADFVQQLESTSGRFDTVLVLGGGNDVIRFTGEDKLRGEVQRVAALAKERGARVIFMPPGNVGNAPFFMRPYAWLMDRRSQELHGLVRQAAAQTGAAYVNLYKDREHDPFAQRPGELHARDGLHPSDAGYALWLQELTMQAAAAMPSRA